MDRFFGTGLAGLRLVRGADIGASFLPETIDRARSRELRQVKQMKAGAASIPVIEADRRH